MTKKYLVTGGSGFIGTNIIELLLRENYSVINLDINKPVDPSHLPYWYKCDIRNLADLRRLIGTHNPDVILHFAARTDLKGEAIESYTSNTIGVENLVNVCNENECVKYVLFASSMLVCALNYSPIHDQDYAPNTTYGESKVIGEKFVLKHLRSDLNFNIIRPTSVWGPWFKAPYHDFFHFVTNGLYIHPYGYKVKRSYSYVENFAFQILELIKKHRDSALNRTLYIADYDPIEVGEWADLIKRNYSGKNVYRLPLIIFTILAKLGDVLEFFGHQNPPLTSFRLKNLLSEKIFDLSLLRKELGPLPFDTETGVIRTLEWMKNQNRLK